MNESAIVCCLPAAQTARGCQALPRTPSLTTTTLNSSSNTDPHPAAAWRPGAGTTERDRRMKSSRHD